jgi:hypothetical protein
VTVQLLALDAATYRRHPLHMSERTWAETNCYVDLWIEVIHALGADPVAAAAFTLSTDFEGDQWTFFKYPPEDLRLVYGVDVAEMNIWRPVIDHIEEQLQLGRLLTVEVDSWFLPDTEGVSYRREHAKTTIVPQMLDRPGRRLGYFHGSGYWELSGEDFTGVFPAESDRSAVLPPYVELVKLERFSDRSDNTLQRALSLTQDHLTRRPATNPIARFGDRIRADVPWLARHDLDTFHQYAFGTCRQCGASAELAATFVRWLGDRDGGGLEPAAGALDRVATGAKNLQFALARVARGRKVDLDATLAEMEEAWGASMAALVDRYG